MSSPSLLLHIKKTSASKLFYLLYLPRELRGETDDDMVGKTPTKWPLILYLHGAGEKGPQLSRLMKQGMLPAVIDKEPNFPFITVSPQTTGGWSNHTLFDLVQEVKKEYPVDDSRIYGTGLSMGGGGIWSMALKYPDLFAAIVPVCGYMKFVADATRIRHIPQWIFHNKGDPIVPFSYSQELFHALEAVKAPYAKLTAYPAYAFKQPTEFHDSWTETYENPEVYYWMLHHSKQEVTPTLKEELIFLNEKIARLNISQQVRVQFVLRAPMTSSHLTPRMKFVVTGSIPQLGDRDPTKAVVLLKNGNTDLFSGEAMVPHFLAPTFEYRYALLGGDTVGIEWEPAHHQRKVELHPPPYIVTKQDTWC